VCFVFLYNFCRKLLTVRRIQRDIVINVQTSYVKYPLFLSHYTETWIFSTDLWKIPKYQVSLKSVQSEPSCSMRTDGQIDVEAKSHLSRFCEGAQNGKPQISQLVAGKGRSSLLQIVQTGAGASQPPIKWVPGLVNDAITHFHLSLLWMCGVLPPLPIYLHSVCYSIKHRDLLMCFCIFLKKCYWIK
jgi:hypothetical protein